MEAWDGLNVGMDGCISVRMGGGLKGLGVRGLGSAGRGGQGC